MKAFYVEGKYLPRQALKKTKSRERFVEPFARSIWAYNPEGALQIATQELEGGEWVGTPRVSLVSEADRMRSLGAPELPGLETKPINKKS